LNKTDIKRWAKKQKIIKEIISEEIN